MLVKLAGAYIGNVTICFSENIYTHLSTS